MYGARDRPLPMPRGLGQWFPYLTFLIMAFTAIFRQVLPLVDAGAEALRAVRANDHQVRNV